MKHIGFVKLPMFQIETDTTKWGIGFGLDTYEKYVALFVGPFLIRYNYKGGN